jgi:adenosylcobyric acid synthase
MTRSVLVAGTASHVGKSTVAAGLCRLLADRGVDVAPFKAQNMSNNARAVPRPGDGPAYGEIGVSQYVQARAARTPATVHHNPVLLKPRGAGESQLVIHGEAVGHYGAGAYYDEHWDEARAAAVESYERLAAANDVIVAEGAGSIAEINLHDRDLANVETARVTDADVLLVADVERGGVFASLVGTLELMPDDLRERVVGAVVTKFRGDASILEPGVDQFEERTGVPVLGVLPHDDPGLPEEDSVALPAAGERATWSDAGGTGDGGTGPHHGGAESPGGDVVQPRVTVAVPRFPRVSNATDVEPLAVEPGVEVAWLPLEAPLEADAVILPGTKNTVDDLLAAREAGFHDRLRRFDGPVVGLCGGYQMLGERVTGAAVESAGDGPPGGAAGETGAVEGVGLLPVETRFSPEKTVAAVERDLEGVGPLDGAAGRIRGYEIHMGDTRLLADVERPFADDGAARGQVLGTYVHGLFENRVARDAFLDAVFAHAGRERPGAADGRRSPYDRAAALLRDHADLRRLLP